MLEQLRVDLFQTGILLEQAFQDCRCDALGFGLRFHDGVGLGAGPIESHLSLNGKVKYSEKIELRIEFRVFVLGYSPREKEDVVAPPSLSLGGDNIDRLSRSDAGDQREFRVDIGKF